MSGGASEISRSPHFFKWNCMIFFTQYDSSNYFAYKTIKFFISSIRKPIVYEIFSTLFWHTHILT